MLPLFSRNATCAKCGAVAMRTVWVSKCCDTPDHMKRICGACGFEWRERPLDQRTPEEEEAANRTPPTFYRYTTGD